MEQFGTLSKAAKIVIVWDGSGLLDAQEPFRTMLEWAFKRSGRRLAFVVATVGDAEDAAQMTGIPHCRDALIDPDAMNSRPLVLLRDGAVYRGFSFDSYGTQSELGAKYAEKLWEAFAPKGW